MRAINIVSMIAYFVIILSYPFWSKDMFDQSLVDIPNMQNNEGFQNLTEFVKVLQSQSVIALILGVLWAYYLAANSSKSLFFVFTTMFVFWQGTVLNLIYKADRPFWVATEKNPINNFASYCDFDYGSPNLEMMVSTYVYLIAYLNYYHEVGGEQKKFGSVMCTGYIIKMGVTSVLITSLIGFYFSGMYLGQTSYDQGMLSMGLATLFAFWFHFGLKIHFKLLPLYLSRPFNITHIMNWLFNSKMSDKQIQPRQFNSQDRKVFKIGPVAVLLSAIFLFCIPTIIPYTIWKSQHENVFVNVELYQGEESSPADVPVPVNGGNETADAAEQEQQIDNIIYYQKNAFAKNDKKQGDLIIQNLHKNCYLKEQLYPLVEEEDGEEEQGSDSRSNQTDTDGGTRRRNLRNQWYKKHHSNKKVARKPTKKHDLKLSDFEKFQTEVLYGFANEAYLRSLGYCACMFAAFAGYLAELGYFQTSIRNIQHKNLFWPICDKQSDGFTLIRFFMLIIYSLIFYLLSLLLNFTRGLPKTKPQRDSYTAEILEKKFDQSIEFIAFFNEIFGHMVAYLIIFAFARKAFHLLLMIDISAEIKKNSIDHQQLLEKLEEIEKNELMPEDIVKENRSVDDFGQDEDFDSVNQFRGSASVGGFSSTSSASQHASRSKLNNKPNQTTSQRQKSYNSNFDRGQIHDTDIELQYQ